MVGKTNAGGISAPVYNGAHHALAPSGYSVTISLTNPVNAGYAYQPCLEIKEYDTHKDSMGNYDSETGNIYYIQNPTDTETFLFSNTTTVLGISVLSDWPCSVHNRYLITGEATYEQSSMGFGFFVITGDATIVLNGLDYNDD